MADSIVKSWGVVEYKYAGWDVKNFDTLPVSDSIPVPMGEWKVLNGYQPMHVKGKWEYYKRDWKTYEFKPLLGSHLYDYPPDLLDWGRYLVLYVRGKGRYYIGSNLIYKGWCTGWFLKVELDSTWKEIRVLMDTLPMDTLEGVYNIHNPPSWFYDKYLNPSSPCTYRGKFYPLSMGITPLADTFGTYEYEIELSPVYLVR